MTKLFKRLVKEEEGQGMVEYALILFLVSICAILMLTEIGNKVNDVFTDIKDNLM